MNGACQLVIVSIVLKIGSGVRKRGAEQVIFRLCILSSRCCHHIQIYNDAPCSVIPLKVVDFNPTSAKRSLDS